MGRNAGVPVSNGFEHFFEFDSDVDGLIRSADRAFQSPPMLLPLGLAVHASRRDSGIGLTFACLNE